MSTESYRQPKSVDVWGTQKIYTHCFGHICGCCHCRCHYNRWNLDAIINDRPTQKSTYKCVETYWHRCHVHLFFGWLTGWSHFVCGLAIRLSALYMQNTPWHAQQTHLHIWQAIAFHIRCIQRRENRWRATHLITWPHTCLSSLHLQSIKISPYLDLDL